MKQRRRALNATVVKIGQTVEVQLLLGSDNAWRGIGPVTVRDVPLRDGSFPLLPRLDTPEGYQYDHAFLDNVERDKKCSLLGSVWRLP